MFWKKLFQVVLCRPSTNNFLLQESESKFKCVKFKNLPQLNPVAFCPKHIRQCLAQIQVLKFTGPCNLASNPHILPSQATLLVCHRHQHNLCKMFRVLFPLECYGHLSQLFPSPRTHTFVQKSEAT